MFSRCKGIAIFPTKERKAIERFYGPIDDIYKGLKKFKYEAPEDRWGELLAEGVSTDAGLPQVAWVKAKKVYYDLELDRMVNFGEEWECLSKRATYLEDLGLVEITGDYT